MYKRCYSRLSSLCGTSAIYVVYNDEKSFVCTDVAVRTSNWLSDNNKNVEFFRIRMLFAPLRLVLVAQYLISPSLMVDSKFERRHDNHDFTGVSNKTMFIKGSYVVLESSADMGGCCPPQTFPNPQS